MQKQKIVSAILLICSLILPIAIGATLAFQSIDTTPAAQKINPQDITAWNIGDSDAMAGFLNKANAQGAKTHVLDILSFNSNQSIRSSVLSKQSIIMFDGTWLKQNDNQMLNDFVITTVKKVGGLTVTGESTSILYDILDKAGVYTLFRDDSGVRNPVRDNPAIVGFAFKEEITPAGKHYYAPSIFTSNSTDSYKTMQDIASWLSVGGN